MNFGENIPANVRQESFRIENWTNSPIITLITHNLSTDIDVDMLNGLMLLNNQQGNGNIYNFSVVQYQAVRGAW